MRKCKYFLLTVCLIFSLLITASTVVVFAGSVQSNTDNSGFSNNVYTTDDKGNTVLDPNKSEIKSELWNASNDVKNASKNTHKIVFDASTSKRTSYINSYKKVANFNKQTNMLEADVVMKITTLPEDAKFGMSVGLSTLSKAAQSKGSSFIYFTAQESDIYLSVSTYEKDRVETSIFKSATAVTTLNTEFTLRLEVASNGKFAVKVNETEVSHDENDIINAEGYIGFGQTASGCGVEISSIEAKAENNETPANVNFIEKFNGGEFNASLLYARARPTRISDATIAMITKKISNEVGGKYQGMEADKLHFINVSHGYVATKLEYSNVEYSFDFKPQRENSFDEFGYRTSMVSAGFSLHLGVSEYKLIEKNTAQATLDAQEQALINASDVLEVRFDREEGNILDNSVTSFIQVKIGKETRKYILPDSLNIFDDETSKDRAVSVTVTMIDGKLCVYLNYQGEVGLVKVVEQNFANTPNGFIWLRSNGQLADLATDFSPLCNMWIDDISVTNLDMDGVIRDDVSFMTSVWDTYDYIYVDPWLKEE